MENSRLHHQVSLATRKKNKKLCCSNTQISGDWCRLLCPKLNSWFPLAALAAVAATQPLPSGWKIPIFVPYTYRYIPLGSPCKMPLDFQIFTMTCRGSSCSCALPFAKVLLVVHRGARIRGTLGQPALGVTMGQKKSSTLGWKITSKGSTWFNWSFWWKNHPDLGDFPSHVWLRAG